MTCGKKHCDNAPTEATRVDPAEVEGRPLCDHAGCDKRVVGTGEKCAAGHVQGGARSPVGYAKALDGLLALGEQFKVSEPEELWAEARRFRTELPEGIPIGRCAEAAQLLVRLWKAVREGDEWGKGPNLGADPRMQVARNSIGVEDVVAVAADEMWERITDGRIATARDADQSAADIAAEYVGESDGDDYVTVCAALCDIAGTEFPGDWDDEDDMKERWPRSCSYCGRDKDGGTCIICGNFVCDQCQLSTDDGPVCPNCVDAAREQGYKVRGNKYWGNTEIELASTASMGGELLTETQWLNSPIPIEATKALQRLGVARAQLQLLAASAAVLQAVIVYAEDDKVAVPSNVPELAELATVVAATRERLTEPFPPLAAAESLLAHADHEAALSTVDAFTSLSAALREAAPTVREQVATEIQSLRAEVGGALLTPDEKAWAAKVVLAASPEDIRYPLVRAVGRYRREKEAGDAAAAWEWCWLSPDQQKEVLRWLDRTGNPLPLGSPTEWPQLPMEPPGARVQAVFQRAIRALAVSENVSDAVLDRLRQNPPPGEVPLIDLPEDVIQLETRHQLVAEGLLVDVSLPARNEWGYNWPVAVTRGVQAAVQDIAPPFQGVQTPEARLNDILMMARNAARRLGKQLQPESSQERFQLILHQSDSTDWDTWEEGADEEVGLTTLVIERHYASADDPRPCFTISLVDEY